MSSYIYGSPSKLDNNRNVGLVNSIIIGQQQQRVTCNPAVFVHTQAHE